MAKRTTTKKPTTVSHPPISVTLPRTVEQKMEAICALASAQRDLARALTSVNVNVTISGCHIENAQEAGIVVRTEDQ